MTLYLLNSPVLTEYGNYCFSGPLDVEDVQLLLKKDSFVSAIGHQSTATHLSNILGITIPCQRIQISMDPGDKAVVYRLKNRPDEGVTFDVDALAKQSFELSLLERTS